MRVDLLKHNQEAYEKVQKAIKEGKKKIAISHATGTGKSYLVAKLFEDFSNDKKLVLVPSSYIRDQIQGLFEKYNIQNVDVILYQKLIKMSDEDIAAMDYDVIALDEYHHDTSKVWGNKVRTLIDTHSEAIIFGTSATPIRSDGVNTIDELFEGNCASDLPLSESIAKKIVPLPKYVGAMYMLDDELERLRKKVEQATNTKEEKQEFYKTIDSMRGQIEKSYGMPIILNKHIKDKEGKYLVFCKKKRHLQEIKETVIGWFRTAGCKNINAYEVYSDYENKDAEYKAFCEDTSHDLKLMFCVDMLNEGLHLENISGVLLLRPTRSSIVWHQQIGRAIEANNTNTPVIIDAVNNFSAVGQGMELLKEIKDAVAREKESDPDYEDDGFEDIDTFFVLEQVVEIQEMFAEIEGELESNWDLYIKALKQYKEREGDCLVPQKHIEILDSGITTSLGNWVQRIRSRKKGKGRILLTSERIKQLEQLDFVWDEKKHQFLNNVRQCIQFCNENARRPSRFSKNEHEKKLANFLKNNTNLSMLAQWKIDLLKEIPDFFTKKEDRVNMFCRYAILYKKKFGHVKIKTGDTIDNYNIGFFRDRFISDYKDGKLTNDQVKELKRIGIDVTMDIKKQNFLMKMELARQAVSEGIVISKRNQIYKEENLYTWYKTNQEKFTDDEHKIMKELLLEGKNKKKPINIKNVQTNKIYSFSSINEAGRALYSDFHIA